MTGQFLLVVVEFLGVLVRPSSAELVAASFIRLAAQLGVPAEHLALAMETQNPMLAPTALLAAALAGTGHATPMRRIEMCVESWLRDLRRSLPLRPETPALLASIRRSGSALGAVVEGRTSMTSVYGRLPVLSIMDHIHVGGTEALRGLLASAGVPADRCVVVGATGSPLTKDAMAIGSVVVDELRDVPPLLGG